MSKISEIIFAGKPHYLTSPYGKRSVIATSAGKTSSFHNGTDYGTGGKKLPQYAVENGTVLSCGTAADGAKFVWVSYPRIGKKMLHTHLDSIAVKTGQSVQKGTQLGTTGSTGKSTGIHLHLGVKDLKTDQYEDPEVFAASYTPPVKYGCGNYKVIANVLNVREGAGTQYPVKTYAQMTPNAQKQIKSLCGQAKNGYVRGVECTVSAVKNDVWGRTPSGWICLRYCERA